MVVIQTVALSSRRKHGHPADDAKVIFGDRLGQVVQGDRLQTEPADECDDAFRCLVTRDPVLFGLEPDLGQGASDGPCLLAEWIDFEKKPPV